MLPNDCIEQWRAIEGWPGYEVSDFGNVRSRKRMQGMKLRTATNGYRMVMLTDSPRRRNVCVHNLVLSAFVCQRPDGYECRHLDGNKSNNRLDNLRWGTPEENAADKRQHGTTNPGEQQWAAKLTDADAVEIRRRANEGEQFAEIATDYPQVLPSAVARVANGDRFAHLPGSVPKRNARKLTSEQAAEIRRLALAGERQKDIATRFGVKPCTVNLIIHGKRKVTQ